MSDDDDFALIDFLVLELPDGAMRAAGLALLVDIVDGHGGRVSDLVFIHKDEDGALEVVDPSRLGAGDDLDLARLRRLCLGRVSESRIAAAGAHIEAGSSAGILVFAADESPADVVRRPVELLG